MVDILLDVFLQALGPVEVIGPLTAFDRNLGISGAINNLHSIPISLSTFLHESSKLRLWDFVPRHHMVKVFLENYLSILALKLEIVASDCHDTLVDPIVDVACYGGPIGHLLDMVGHDPCILKILARLHQPH